MKQEVKTVTQAASAWHNSRSDLRLMEVPTKHQREWTHARRKYGRRYRIIALLTLMLWSLAATPSAIARSTACATVDKAQIKNLFVLWNDALQDLTARKVIARYDNDATLLPTLENGPYTKGKGLEAYFEDFVKKAPVATIEESTRTIVLGCNVAYDIGLYDFTFKPGIDPAKARYTFVYKWDVSSKKWLIDHHHSSVQPKP